MNRIIHTLSTSRTALILLLATLLTATAAQTAGAQDAITGLTYNSTGGYYEISDAQDLVELANYVNATENISIGKTFKQTQNIDMSSISSFTPIGERGGDYSFAGTYDGGGHTISGLTVSINYGDIGLFGVVKGATVSNVILLSPNVNATTTSDYSVSLGALIGTCNSGSNNLVENCHVVNPTVSSSSTSSRNYVGAIIGNIWDTNTTATNCYYYGGNATAACGYIENGAPVTRVCAAHLVTPADGVTIQTPMAADLGFTCDADKNGTPENYWRTGAQLTLSNSVTGAPQGYQYGYTASAGTLSGTTLTMPDQDVTISVNTADLAPIDWATVNQGNSADPYMIYNKDQLLLLAHRVNGTNGETANDYYGKYFKLGADITFSHDANEGDDYAENYEAIGGYIGGTIRYFLGDFDGDGHTVSGIRIRKDGSGNTYIDQGLFGCIGSDAEIHDVHLTDARITGYQNVGGIAGYNNQGYIKRCSVTDSYITANGNWVYGTICGGTSNTSRLTNNYYHGCTVNGTENATNVGCCDTDIADIAANHGALPAYRLDLGANITTPPGTFAGQTEWLDTPPDAPRLAPENGFTLAGNHYFASGYEFTPGSTLASGAAQGYTPRATLGGQLLDLYTPSGDAPDYTGTAIARLTITADCDGKTLSAAIRSDGLQHDVSYTEADGTTQTAQAVALDGHETNLAAGWYFMGKDISYDATLTLGGNVTLILCDGCEMKVGESGEEISGNGIKRDGDADLTIYGQTAQTGTLSVYVSGDYWNAIGPRNLTINGGNVIASAEGKGANGLKANGGGDITINGGNVNATATGSGAWGIASQGNVEINGGTVNASGDVGIQSSNNLAINGGNITASSIAATINGSVAINGGNVTASSISTLSGTITLGWTRPADRITASSISTDGGTVAVKDGQALTDGSGHIYTGTLSADDLAALAGKTLQPWLVLNETDGVTPLTALAGQANVPVIFTRTFSANVASTICLPFAISADQATTAGKFYSFAGVNTSGSDWVVTMQEANAANAALAANTPYLFMPSANSEVTFSGTIGNVADTYTAGTTDSGVWTYRGTYETIEWPSDPGNIYGFASGQAYGNSGDQTEAGKFIRVHTGGIRPFRAYLEYNGSAGARAMSGSASSHELPETMTVRLIGADGQTSAIGTLDTRTGEATFGTDEWYTLDGVKLSAKPTAKGIYIYKGKKVIIK